MLKFYTLILISFILFSCGRHLNYLGKSSEPTEKVDVFVDANTITRPYTIVGKGYMVGYAFSPKSIEIMQKKALKKAKEKGADAILFQDYFVTENATGIHTITTSDSIGKSHVITENTRVGPIVSSRTDILFLKYNNQ